MNKVKNEKEKPVIYIFGNELLKEDSVPIKIKPELEKHFPKIDFVYQDPNENIKPKDKKMILIDSAQGIEEIKILDSLQKLETLGIPASLHDFDLAFNLKLLEKIGKLEEVFIIAIPQEIDEKTALKETTKALEKLK